MLNWAILFLVAALLFAFLGFQFLGATIAAFAQLLFPVCIVLFVISLIAGLSNRPLG